MQWHFLYVCNLNKKKNLLWINFFFFHLYGLHSRHDSASKVWWIQFCILRCLCWPLVTEVIKNRHVKVKVLLDLMLWEIGVQKERKKEKTLHVVASAMSRISQFPRVQLGNKGSTVFKSGELPRFSLHRLINHIQPWITRGLVCLLLVIKYSLKVSEIQIHCNSSH